MSEAGAERITTARIEAAVDLPLVRLTRDFRATPAQLVRAHTDPELFVRWIGPRSRSAVVDRWEARTGGGYRYAAVSGGGAERDEQWFHGSFHHVGPDRLVQTFTWEGMPEAVSLETMTFEDLGHGWTRLHATSLVDSFAAREAMLASGMEVGINEGWAALDALLASGAV